MTIELTEKPFSKKWFTSYTLILAGSFIMAVGMVLFIAPYKLAPGGVYGIAITLHYLYKIYYPNLIELLGTWIPANLDIGIVGICFDIPLCLIGTKILGRIFGIKTVVGFCSLSFFIYILENVWGYAPFVDDAMLSALYGGVLIGIGLSFVLKARATTGGSDIIAMILSKYTHMRLGTLIMIVDSCIVLFPLFTFQDWKIPLYSWLVIFITGKIVDTVIYGSKHIKTMFIISEKHAEIAKYILSLDRGGTIMYGKGIYSGKEKEVIFTNVNVREVVIIQEYITKIDPAAFITLIDAYQVIGEGRGFKSIHEH